MAGIFTKRGDVDKRYGLERASQEDIKVEDSANQEMLKIDKKVEENGGRSVE